MSDAQLELAAEILGPLVAEVVFVGGATVHLWLTDPGAPPVRATDDVDVICEVASRVECYRLGDRLRGRGLHEASDEPVVCRWRHTETGLAIDVIPPVADVLGFSNPWYQDAIATAELHTLDSSATIRVTRPAVMAATKLSAWKGRGRGDLLRSLDVHDILTLIHGRQELTTELEADDEALQSFVAAERADNLLARVDDLRTRLARRRPDSNRRPPA